MAGLLERGEDEEPLAVVGDHIWLRPACAGKYGGSFEQEAGDTGFEGRAVGLHVYCKVAAVELVVEFFAVATPSGYLPSRLWRPAIFPAPATGPARIPGHRLPAFPIPSSDRRPTCHWERIDPPECGIPCSGTAQAYGAARGST